MLVGGAGTGKTTLMKDKLRNLDADQYGFLNVNLNCFTDSMLLQVGYSSTHTYTDTDTDTDTMTKKKKQLHTQK